jgi:DNA polymerase-3 subunit gamma/tau
MSYLVLARKYRPRVFAEMVGQEHVVRALTNALDSGRVHHAFLFTGTRGVGKTTVARIFAKSLNCETGVTATPCGRCSACREIDEGRFVDLLEVDAASRTKIDDTRELLDNVQYTPARGRYKVYLIDEVHMLSTHSFNALLKTLEEPPPHVKFLLATTDPQKLPITVVSRCLQFHLKRLPPGLIVDRMKHVLGEERVEFEAPALPLLARAADGSLRDGLSLLDQVLVFGAGRVGEADVRAMLGTIDRNHVLRIAGLLADADGPGLLAALRALAEHSPDYDLVLQELATLLERIALHQVVPDTGDEGPWATAELAALAPRLPPEDVQLYYQFALLGRRDLELAPDPATGFEMTILRMLAFRPDLVVEPAAAAAPTGAGAARAASGRAAGPAASASTVSPTRAAPAAAATSTSRAPLPTTPPSPSPSPLPSAPAAAGATPGDEADWQALIARLELSGLGRQLAANCAWIGRERDVVRLRLDPRSAALRTANTEERLTQALQKHFGPQTRLAIEAAEGGEVEADTPARRQAREAEAQLAAARTALEQDPTVRAFQDRFGAAVQPDSVKPLR